MAIAPNLRPREGVAGTRNAAMDNLRVFIVLLVLAHHTALGYHPYAPPPATSLGAQPMAWLAHPVVDGRRWPGIEALVAFNDVFFMSLMFFVAGLFVWSSLVRKGAARFARDRALRLGIPFAIAAAVLSPLAYYPTYLQTGTGPDGRFWEQWRALPHWPSGPAWFVWVLLVFSSLAAALYRLAPRWGDLLGGVAGVWRRPGPFFCLLVAISALAYVPLALAFGAGTWLDIGPFSLQKSRPLLYALYFFAGVGVGAHGLDHGILAPQGTLAHRWPLWVVTALIAFAPVGAFLLATVSRGGHSGARPLAFYAVGNISFVVSCAASSLALLALFVRFAQGRGVLSRFGDEAYGMYLTHYVFVTWLQYVLLPASLPAAAKATLVFVGTVALSWSVTAALRRIPVVARIV